MTAITLLRCLNVIRGFSLCCYPIVAIAAIFRYNIMRKSRGQPTHCAMTFITLGTSLDMLRRQTGIVALRT